MRDLEQDARTVAGVGLIAHPASMRHPFEHVDRLVDQNVALFPIGLHDHTESVYVRTIGGDCKEHYQKNDAECIRLFIEFSARFAIFVQI